MAPGVSLFAASQLLQLMWWTMLALPSYMQFNATVERAERMAV